ncbi:hypothetical protein CEXT_575381 [Caerostris extrusa]|uniref:Uncharacterized protein n=1 Tax=Caerostris extrusa TaxID=172846 RepID=A0AAV4YEH6_CAEEX|nr:hypothetical protein CEXT_575381 [Caerostris extrusa]
MTLLRRRFQHPFPKCMPEAEKHPISNNTLLIFSFLPHSSQGCCNSEFLSDIASPLQSSGMKRRNEFKEHIKLMDVCCFAEEKRSDAKLHGTAGICLS